jgi:hypothetical protein
MISYQSIIKILKFLIFNISIFITLFIIMINLKEKIIYIGIIILIFLISFNYSYNLCIETFIAKELSVPKKIYIFDDDSSLANVNIDSIKLNTPLDWDIISLNEKNIGNYISKDNLDKYSNLKGKKFGDLVTLDILYNYGGIIIDSSVRIYSGEVLNNYITNVFNEEYDISLIEFNPIIKENTNKSNDFFRNWIYIAPKNSKFVKNLHTELYKKYSLDFDNFIKIEKITDNKLLSMPSYNQTLYVHYIVINRLLKNGFLYKTNSKIEKSKKVYGIKLAKENLKNEANINILNYIFKSNL